MLMVVAATREELGPLAGEALGVGPVVVAARMATLLAQRKPDAVVLIGTAGAYPGGPPIGEPIAARRVGLSPSVAAMGLGYVPRPPVPLVCDAQMTDAIEAAKHDVLTVSAITTDPTLTERLADSWQVEHMEAYGVAVACAHAGVPFACCLGIANDVGPNAHMEWLMHRNAAQDRAREAVAKLLEQHG